MTPDYVKKKISPRAVSTPKTTLPKKSTLLPSSITKTKTKTTKNISTRRETQQLRKPKKKYLCRPKRIYEIRDKEGNYIGNDIEKTNLNYDDIEIKEIAEKLDKCIPVDTPPKFYNYDKRYDLTEEERKKKKYEQTRRKKILRLTNRLAERNSEFCVNLRAGETFALDECTDESPCCISNEKGIKEWKKLLNPVCKYDSGIHMKKGKKSNVATCKKGKGGPSSQFCEVKILKDRHTKETIGSNCEVNEEGSRHRRHLEMRLEEKQKKKEEYRNKILENNKMKQFQNSHDCVLEQNNNTNKIDCVVKPNGRGVQGLGCKYDKYNCSLRRPNITQKKLHEYLEKIHEQERKVREELNNINNRNVHVKPVQPIYNVVIKDIIDKRNSVADNKLSEIQELKYSLYLNNFLSGNFNDLTETFDDDNFFKIILDNHADLFLNRIHEHLVFLYDEDNDVPNEEIIFHMLEKLLQVMKVDQYQSMKNIVEMIKHIIQNYEEEEDVDQNSKMIFFLIDKLERENNQKDKNNSPTKENFVADKQHILQILKMNEQKFMNFIETTYRSVHQENIQKLFEQTKEFLENLQHKQIQGIFKKQILLKLFHPDKHMGTQLHEPSQQITQFINDLETV